ncbi:MAG: hypothetical protein H8E05_00970 [Bacteroidetes bacterium]|nr:hypothetical protein [Bacteroidota bacterium]
MSDNNLKRGRPKTPVVWPEGEFTAGQAFSVNSTKVSRVSIHNKINQALADGLLVKVKKLKTKVGRPSNIYQTASLPVTQQMTDDIEELDF